MAGVYISYPFCAQKCTYCNFASGVATRRLQEEYLEALGEEIRGHIWQWRPETVYLGGGTPSAMEEEALARLFEALPDARWLEATIEAAPGGITARKARAWRRAGITRVSLGVQSFVAGEIARTGRKHTAAIVAAEVALLRDAGIAGINIDLIAGLAGQTRSSWIESLAWVDRVEPEHVSVYMLEVDDDSRLGREILAGGARYGAREVPVEDTVAELYELAVDELARQGLARYEISNFARPGHESRHNRKYWLREPYAGFGADAHSFDGQRRWQNVESAREYVERRRAGRSPAMEATPAQADQERFFLGLRLSEGILPHAEEWLRWREPIEGFLSAGLIERHGDRLKLSRRGVLLSNEVFQEFVQ